MYGIHCPEIEAKVKELYKLIRVPNAYHKYEEHVYREIMTKIRRLPACVPKKPIRQALNSIYKRVK